MICTKCKKNKLINQFGKCKRKKSGLQTQCKGCKREYTLKYQTNHRIQCRKNNRKFYANHREEIAKRRVEKKEWAKKYWQAYSQRTEVKQKRKENARKYYEKNKERLLIYSKQRRKIKGKE